MIIGSCARRTAIRPLNDVDLFFELDPQAHGARRDGGPNLLLEDVLRALQTSYPSSAPNIRMQGRSVHIDFSSTGIGYDVIPALRADKPGDGKVDIYEIPNRSGNDWIKTSPEAHKQRCIEANEKAGGMLNRLIKAAKHWNRSHRDASGAKPLRSFHLEVMSYEAFESKPDNERVGLLRLFEFLRSRVQSSCPDPAGVGPAIDEDLSRNTRDRARDALSEAARLAGEAIRYDGSGDTKAARARWRSLLGPEFGD